MKKMDTQIQTPSKRRETIPKNPMKPTTNQWEFHRDVTRHGQPKGMGGTQEILRQQK
jgi:hypothetical protein